LEDGRDIPILLDRAPMTCWNSK